MVYGLGQWVSATLLFLAAEIPMFALTSWIVRSNPRLRYCGPFLWALTVTLVWSYHWSKESRPNDFVAISFGVLLAYFLERAVMGSAEEFASHRHDESLATLLAALLSAWGATLQVVVLFSFLITPILKPVIEATWLGGILLEMLQAFRRTSPWSLLPSGLLLLGLCLYAAARLQTDPYHVVNYSEVLVTERSAVMSVFLMGLRLPTWVCVVVGGFVLHFV